MDKIATKVENLEKRSTEVEQANDKKFDDLKDEIAQVENKVTNKLIKEIEPSLGKMKDEIETTMNNDLRRIVQEEVALQKMREMKEAGDAAEGGPEKNKNQNNKKNNKTQ